MWPNHIGEGIKRKHEDWTALLKGAVLKQQQKNVEMNVMLVHSRWRGGKGEGGRENRNQQGWSQKWRWLRHEGESWHWNGVGLWEHRLTAVGRNGRWASADDDGKWKRKQVESEAVVKLKWGRWICGLRATHSCTHLCNSNRVSPALCGRHCAELGIRDFVEKTYSWKVYMACSFPLNRVFVFLLNS